jgi:O-antigen ligase
MIQAATAPLEDLSTSARPRSRGAKASARDLSLTLDPLRIMLMVLTILNVSRFHLAFPVLKPLRPGLLLVIAAAGYAFLNAKSITRANIMAWWPMRRVALLGVVSIASVAFGISLGKSALFILKDFSKTILFCFLIALSIRHVRDLFTFVWALAISSGILSYFAIFIFKIQKSDFSRTDRLGDLYTYDANDVCVIMLVGLASVLLLMQVVRGWQRGVLFFFLIGIGATIARSGSRGGFIGLVAFGAAALFLINSVALSKRLLLLGTILAGMVVFAPPGYMAQMATILEAKKDYNAVTPNGRKALAVRGLRYMAAYPVFGVGISNFGKAECELSGMATGAGGTRCGAPHNSYVQAAAETGIVGGLVWCSIVLGGIWGMFKLRRRLPRRWSRGNKTERFLYGATTYFAIGLVGFAVSSFFVSFAWMDILYLQVALISGLYLSIAVYNSTPSLGGAVSAPARAEPGWRVKQSAQRRLLAVPVNRRLQGPR